MVLKNIWKSISLLKIFLALELTLNGRTIGIIHGSFACHSGIQKFFLSSIVFIHLLFRKEIFPYGISKLKIFQKSFIELVIIPPGGFYTIVRRANELEIEKEFSYGYTLNYGIFMKLNKKNNPCNKSLNFLEDTCKLSQVKYKI